MNALSIAAIVFACCFGAGLTGLFLHRVVPDQHLDPDSKDTVKLVMGLIATMAALVLSLLIASAKSSFDAQQTGVEQLVTDVIELDHQLGAFGPETKHVREGLRAAMVGLHDRIWSPASVNFETLDPRAMERQYDALVDAVRALTANTDMQRGDQKAALDLAGTIAHTRLMMFVETTAHISTPLLVILILWVATLFLGFGLFARLNPTVAAAFFVGSLCVAAAIFLILELNTPFSGLMRMSDARSATPSPVLASERRGKEWPILHSAEAGQAGLSHARPVSCLIPDAPVSHSCSA
jgi:hypothetical protein